MRSSQPTRIVGLYVHWMPPLLKGPESAGTRSQAQKDDLCASVLPQRAVLSITGINHWLLRTISDELSLPFSDVGRKAALSG